jgi:endonuclease G
MKSLIAAALFLLSSCMPAFAGDLPAPCADFIPFGPPTVAGHLHTTLACRIGYVAQVNGDTLQPDWVAWRLTSERAIGGCVPRTNPFHADEQLPPGFAATPSDYAKSGYDLGHMSGYEDNAVSRAMGRDSFDVPTNFSPQVGGLNREAWEEFEQDSRVWAFSYGDLDIIDGPIFGATPSTIGSHKVAIPAAFWKIVYSEMKHQAVAIIMRNEPTPKGHLPMYVVSIADIERAAGIAIALPAEVDRIHVVLPWDADAPAYAKAKKAACAATGKGAAQ